MKTSEIMALAEELTGGGHVKAKPKRSHKHGDVLKRNGNTYYYNSETGSWLTSDMWVKHNNKKSAEKRKAERTAKSQETTKDFRAADNESVEKAKLYKANESKKANRVREVEQAKHERLIASLEQVYGIDADKLKGITDADGLTLAEKLASENSEPTTFADEENILNGFEDDSALWESSGGSVDDPETNSFEEFTNQYLEMINSEAARQETKALEALGQNSLQNRRDIQKRRAAAIKSGMSASDLAMEEMNNVMAGQRGATQLAKTLQDNKMGLINDFYGNTQNLMSVNYTADQARAGQNDMAMSAFLNNQAVADALGVDLEDVLKGKYN